MRDHPKMSDVLVELFQSIKVPATAVTVPGLAERLFRSPDMPKRTTSLPCNAENCGINYTVCGSTSTYANRKCRCDACYAAKSASDRAYNLKNREQISQKRSEYYQANRDTVLAKQKEFRDANPELVREQKRRDYEKHYEKRLSAIRRWKNENPGYNQRYYLQDPEYHRQRALRYAKLNPQRRCESERRRRGRKRGAVVVPFTREQWEQKRSYWGSKCYLQIPGLCTGGGDTMDHVIPLNVQGRRSAHMLANLRPACLPCNASKQDTWPYPISFGPS